LDKKRRGIGSKFKPGAKPYCPLQASPRVDRDGDGRHHQEQPCWTTLHPGNWDPTSWFRRYAVRIGEIDVLVISDGVLPLPARCGI
jgi:hypothetical protein